MKINKYLAMATAAACLSANTMAQENNDFRKNNWFITGGVNTEAFMNTNGYVTAAGKLGAGVWINPYVGLKLEGVAGNTHLLEESRGQVFGGSLSYMAHIYGGNSFKRFNLIGVASMGFYHHKFDNILKNYSYMNVLTGSVGIQAVYNISPNWSVYIEPGILVQPKYYEPKYKDDVAVSAYFSAGITYSFGKKFHGNNMVQKPVSATEFERMNRELNEIRAELQNMKNELANAKVVDETKRVVLEPLKSMPSVEVKFDVMGSVLKDSEMRKLDDIGVWMQDHPNSITVVPFTDLQADKAIEKSLKKERVECIINVLTEKYGIDRKRIKVAEPEELGYVNKTTAAAMVIFMAE